MDIDASNWSEDDNSNTTAAPDGAPEGMAPSGVNNVLRAIMGALKRRRNWRAPKTTAGTATAYTLTYGVAPGAYVDGMSFMVELHVAPGAGATLNVNLLGAMPIRHFYNGTWYLLPPAWCAAGSILKVIYHASSGVFRVADSVQSIPAGTSQVNRSSTTPAGWLAEDGSAISRTQFPALFAAIGTTYGAGDGSMTFNLPDSRGYVDAGVGGALGSSLGAKVGGTSSVGSVSGSFSGGGSGSAVGAAISDSPSSDVRSMQPGGDFAAGPIHPHVVNINIPVSVSVSGSISGSSSTSTVQPTMLANRMIRI